MTILGRLNLKIKRELDTAFMILARFAACFVDGRNMWLISEKLNEARDNGYWMYRYLRTHHPELKVYYAITPDSSDYHKVAEMGKEKIIVANSFRHRVLFWASQYNTTSQPQGDYFHAFTKFPKLWKKYQVRTFLQHGIIKDNLTHFLDKDKSGIDIFITSAKSEQDAVILRHGYNDQSCALTGLCRYDNLPLSNHNHSRKILVMPTFRHWLLASLHRVPSEDEKEVFSNDDFCKTYKSLFSSKHLERILQKYDYTMVFYPHYCAQPYLDCFRGEDMSSRVILASNKEYDVQSLLIESDILITDFSSIFFDFAYMKKPEIFYQFDEERYRKGHYEEGYFRYRDHAFGPVFSEEEPLIDYLELLLKENAIIEEKYAKRVDDFFAFRDKNNCERIYNFIRNYKKQ